MAGCLILSGLALLLSPEASLKLTRSTADYGTVGDPLFRSVPAVVGAGVAFSGTCLWLDRANPHHQNR